MKNLMLVLTLSLTCAWLGSTVLAQNATENPPTVPADTKPKPPAKASSKNGAKARSTVKLTKKDDATKEEAAPLTPGPAVVKVKNLNVRGKAAINSEVVSHLKRGDHITVLEEVTIKNPKADEPAKWAKIALPTNAPAWVHASFIDPNKKTVVPKKLNLRSGPGENYSVIGTITNGVAITEVETKGNWIRIEPLPNSYAFVAAHMIANEAAPVAVASTEVPKAPTPAPAVVIPPPVTTPPPAAPVTPPPAQTEVAAAKPPVVGTDPAVSTPPPTTPVVSSPVVAAPPSTPPPVAEPIRTPPPIEPAILRAPEPATPAGPPKVDPDEDVKRVVTREGIVKRSVSIQAPTYFVLENLANGKTINYLFSSSTNLVLKDYRGKRVIVSGEEELDERWPNTPVITIDKLETVP